MLTANNIHSFVQCAKTSHANISTSMTIKLYRLASNNTSKEL